MIINEPAGGGLPKYFTLRQGYGYCEASLRWYDNEGREQYDTLNNMLGNMELLTDGAGRWPVDLKSGGIEVYNAVMTGFTVNIEGETVELVFTGNQ